MCGLRSESQSASPLRVNKFSLKEYLESFPEGLEAVKMKMKEKEPRLKRALSRPPLSSTASFFVFSYFVPVVLVYLICVSQCCLVLVCFWGVIFMRCLLNCWGNCSCCDLLRCHLLRSLVLFHSCSCPLFVLITFI